MYHSSTRRGVRAVALAFLTLAALVASAGCGKDGGGGLTDPLPSDPGDPGPSNPGPGPGPQGPAPVGDVIYAVDLANNFLVFGSGSLNVLTAKMKITGLPILKRIIGIAEANGKLYGVGNDSRVYTIDPLTAVATPVGPEFSPKIASFFDIHFAMSLEPNGERVRLIAAESGGNWSINLADGTATLEDNARYAPGTALAGRTPRLLGIAYPTLPDSAKQPGWCGNLAYGLDADEAIVVASCNPATGEWWPTGNGPEASIAAAAAWSSPRMSVAGSGPKAFEDLKDEMMRCGEWMLSPSGSESDGEREPQPLEGPWFPRSPDTEFWVFLVQVGTLQNQVAKTQLITPKDIGVNIIDVVPTESPIQSATFAKGGLYGPSANSSYNLRRGFQQEVSLSTADTGPEAGADPAPQTDPRAQCVATAN